MQNELKNLNPLKEPAEELDKEQKRSIRKIVEGMHPQSEIEQIKTLRETYGWGLREAYALVLSWRNS